MTETAARSGWNAVARRIRVPLGFLFATFYLWRAWPTWLSLAIGTAVAVVGILFRAVASGYVKKNEELATTGPYAFCRNPLYLGSIIIALGFAIAARDVWIAVVIVALFILIYVPVIRAEEAFLRTRFVEYSDYARRVPRLLPNTLRFSGLTTGFSSRLYMQHREYNVIIGAAGMLAALVVRMLRFAHTW